MSTTLQPGCYFDGWRGWTISCEVIRLAVELGWTDDDAVRLAGMSDDAMSAEEIWLDVANDAETYIQANHVAEGFYCGTTEGDNSWGVWAIEGDDQ